MSDLNTVTIWKTVRLTFLSANLSGKSCVTIHPAPLELLLGGDASELVDTDFSDFVLNKIKRKKKLRKAKKKQIKTERIKKRRETGKDELEMEEKGDGIQIKSEGKCVEVSKKEIKTEKKKMCWKM